MGVIFQKYDYTLEMLEQRIGEMVALPLSENRQQIIFRSLLGILDLTTLEGSDTGDRVASLCRQARFSVIDGSYPDAAAICVYPSMVKYARKELLGTGIHIASVAGGFPAGQTSLHVKLEEIKYAIGEGADEIDTVISRGKLLEGRDTEVLDELLAIREVCGNTHLKVILETGELSSVAMVRKASELAILSGADFIKTSTGKIAAGASPAAFLVMLDTILEYLEKTGKTIGIKPAGGIRKPDQALLYSRLLMNVLGEEVFDKNYFRIGASSLAGEILRTLGTPSH